MDESEMTLIWLGQISQRLLDLKALMLPSTYGFCFLSLIEVQHPSLQKPYVDGSIQAFGFRSLGLICPSQIKVISNWSIGPSRHAQVPSKLL